jgi:hypothetical protein
MDWQALLSSGVALHVLRNLASSKERLAACRMASRECRALIDTTVKGLRVSVTSLRRRARCAAFPCAFPHLCRLHLEASDSSSINDDVVACLEAYPKVGHLAGSFPPQCASSECLPVKRHASSRILHPWRWR